LSATDIGNYLPFSATDIGNYLPLPKKNLFAVS